MPLFDVIVPLFDVYCHKTIYLALSFALRSAGGVFGFAPFTTTMNSNESSNDSRVKRQRMSSHLPLTANDLSADIWCDIADFLPKTSRALLAVALTAPSASFRESGWKGQPNIVSKAIISSVKDDRVISDSLINELIEDERTELLSTGKRRGSKRHGHVGINNDFRNSLAKQIKKYYDSQWEVMDFVDISKSLASRLTDDDVGAVLVCIDAKNKLKRLKLTHCFNVVGIGLEPLRRSTVMEYFDLEFVRELEEPWIEIEGHKEFDEIMLCEGPVFDVLDDILREKRNSLKRFQYPCKWYDNATEPDSIKRLPERIENASQIMRDRRFNNFASNHNAVVNKFACCLYFGTANVGPLCISLEANFLHDDANVCFFCGGANYSFCSCCYEILCIDCSDTNGCNVCDVRYCAKCCRDDEIIESRVTFCGDFSCPSYCSPCRLDSCKDGDNTCGECKKLAFDALLEECNAKQTQVDALQMEIDKLRRCSHNGVKAPTRVYKFCK